MTLAAFQTLVFRQSCAHAYKSTCVRIARYLDGAVYVDGVLSRMLRSDQGASCIPM